MSGCSQWYLFNKSHTDMQRVRVRVVDYNIMCFSFSAWVRLCSRLDECAIVHSEFALHIYMYPERKVLHFLSRLFVCLFVFSSLLLQTKCLIIVCTRNKNYYFLLILFVYCCCCFSFILGCCFWWRKRGEKKNISIYVCLCVFVKICCFSFFSSIVGYIILGKQNTRKWWNS